MPISLPDELRAQVKALEQDIQKNKAEALKAAGEENKLQKETEAHRATMGFWDRNFWGWFGSKEKIGRHRELKSLTAQFNEKAAKLNQKASGLDRQIESDIDAFLRKNDLGYQLLLAPQQAAADLKDASKKFLGKIDSALSAVGSAQTTELLDLFTDSSAISVLSTMDNSSAQSAISSVKRAAPDFQKAIETYNASMSSFKASSVQVTGVDDTLDMVFDLALGGGFDFMSMFSLSALNDAESDLKGLRGDVKKVDDTVGEHLQKTENAVKAYKAQARLACG